MNLSLASLTFRKGDLAFLNGWKYKVSYGDDLDDQAELTESCWGALACFQLGAEILTPFGRAQLFNLGVSFRTKYGALLDAPPFPPTSKTSDANNDAIDAAAPRRKLVFRTESQDRMLKSSQNFAAGFFGIPFEEQYHQLVMIEWPGYNSTLAALTCANAARVDLSHGYDKMREWLDVYLEDARARLQDMVEGVELRVRDVFNMQRE